MPKKVQLYTRINCHLCDVAKDVLARLRKETEFDLETIDVDKDPAIAAVYGLEVPVIFVNGKKAAKFRIDEPMFLRRLREED